MAKYITKDRVLIEAIKLAHERLGIDYALFSDEWIVKLQKQEKQHMKTHLIWGCVFNVNAQASAAIATDKVAAYELLKDGGIACVPHYLLSSVDARALNIPKLQEVMSQYGTLVMKPTFGSNGELVAKVHSIDEAIDHADKHSISSWSVSSYIDIEREIRIVVFNDTVRLAYEKRAPTVVNDLNMYNLCLGATARRLDLSELDPTTEQLALDAMRAIGLKMGAVDVIADQQGGVQVLEINASFTLGHYVLSSPESREEVIEFYISVLGDIFRE